MRQGMQIYISLPEKTDCLGQQVASINHAKGFEGKNNCT